VTQQNAALVEEASAAAQALTEQASNLTQLIARYKVGEGADEAQRAPAAPARPKAVASAPPVERRSPTRPLTGKKRPTPVAAAGNGAAAEEWKDF
jgi:methyl-accepting chemotaxis protein